MREREFFERRRKNWAQYEAMMKSKEKVDPDRLASLFVEVTDDLSYARTHFPEGRSTEFLNSLAAQTHLRIYRGRREKVGKIKSFWTRDVPVAIRRSHRELLFSLILTLMFVFIGYISASKDSGFTRLIMGHGYVDMTLENIEKGDPMGVYGTRGHFETTMYIMFNNLQVMAKFFFLGITFGLGTLLITFYNSVMLGSFHHMMINEGQGVALFSAVYMHGTIELTTMVVSTAAGFVLARGLLFPGTYSRMVSFRKYAAQGGTVIIGIMPLVVIAAFIEGYLTRYYQNTALSITVIVASVVFVAWYYVLFPIQVDNKIKRAAAAAESEQPNAQNQVRTA
ncbi:MAG: stage II sporulation protein M [Bacteroidota bacterium]